MSSWIPIVAFRANYFGVATRRQPKLIIERRNNSKCRWCMIFFVFHFSDSFATVWGMFKKLQNTFEIEWTFLPSFRDTTSMENWLTGTNVTKFCVRKNRKEWNNYKNGEIPKFSTFCLSTLVIPEENSFLSLNSDVSDMRNTLAEFSAEKNSRGFGNSSTVNRKSDKA